MSNQIPDVITVTQTSNNFNPTNIIPPSVLKTDKLKISTSPTNNILYVDVSNNRVGINTINPDASLHVVGSMLITGTIYSRDSLVNDTTLNIAPVGTTPNIGGATLDGLFLRLEPCSDLFPGVISTTTQSFAGDKTFTGGISFPTLSPNSTLQLDATKTVVSQQINLETQVSGVLNTVSGGTTFSAPLVNGKNMVIFFTPSLGYIAVIYEGKDILSSRHDSSGATVSGLTVSPVNFTYFVERYMTVCTLTFINTDITITDTNIATITPGLPTLYCPPITIVKQILIKDGSGYVFGLLTITPSGSMTIKGTLNSDSWVAGNGAILNGSVTYSNEPDYIPGRNTLREDVTFAPA